MRMRREAQRIEARSEFSCLALNQNQMIDFLGFRLDTRWCVTELGEAKAAVACINKNQCVSLFEGQINSLQP